MPGGIIYKKKFFCLVNICVKKWLFFPKIAIFYWYLVNLCISYKVFKREKCEIQFCPVTGKYSFLLVTGVMLQLAMTHQFQKFQRDVEILRCVACRKSKADILIICSNRFSTTFQLCWKIFSILQKSIFNCAEKYFQFCRKMFMLRYVNQQFNHEANKDVGLSSYCKLWTEFYPPSKKSPNCHHLVVFAT